ncbi:MAG: hypothetical protein PVI04_03260 [Anaerolineales bacterium]|jgi:hypothetical protein
MQSIEFNLDYLASALREMEDYLMQSELFWPLSSSTGIRQNFPRMTIANVLLTLNELEAQESELSPAQYSRASSLQAEWEALHTKWSSAVEKRAIEEMRARLNLWKAYVLDLEGSEGRKSNYDQEVKQRVRFTLLRERIGSSTIPDELIDEVQAVDQRALGLTTPSDFVWDEKLQPLYPAGDYSFLYRRPIQAS